VVERQFFFFPFLPSSLFITPNYVAELYSDAEIRIETMTKLLDANTMLSARKTFLCHSITKDIYGPEEDKEGRFGEC